MNRTSKIISAGLVALLVTASGARADLAEVKQVVYGMDCAPCAYSVQKNLEALPGVESAKVSLNDGTVDVKLKPGSGVTVAKIQQVIKNAGFTPKEAKTIER